MRGTADLPGNCGPLAALLAERPEDRFAQPGEVAAALRSLRWTRNLTRWLPHFSAGRPTGRGTSLDCRPCSWRARGVAGRDRRDTGIAAAPKKATFWFLSVALACVLIALATTLAVVLRIQRGGRETVLHVPDASEVTVSGNGEVRIRVSDGSTAPPLTTDWERRVAEWALKTNARIHLFTRDGKLHKIDRAESCPGSPLPFS